MMRLSDSEDEKGKKKRKIDIKSPEKEAEGEQPEQQKNLRGAGEGASALGAGGTSSDADTGAEAQGLAKEEEEVEELQEKYLRLAAEFENYKKRIVREQKELAERATGSLVAEILTVLDNLERAEESARSVAGAESIAEGINIIIGQLKAILKKEGVEEIAALGQKFDPARHEAVMVEEARTGEDQIIVEEFQKGYVYKGRVLRPSKVKVAIYTPGDGKPPPGQSCPPER